LLEDKDMVDFANANLCGASPELNDVLSKLEDAKADITAKLDASASAASAAFGEARNELEGLKNKLQTIEIPAIPKLNLQAEMANLTSLVPGTPSFLSALAKVKLEFEDDIKGAGLDLGTLVADATAKISGGGDLCALVPNLEKASGSLDAATTKPAAVTQAAEKAISEASSVIQQNANILKRVENNKAKIEAFVTTKLTPTIEEIAAMKIPPTEDTGAFVVADKTNTKTISIESSSKVTVTTSGGGQGVNVAAADSMGFNHKRTKKEEYVKFEDLQISESGITFTNLKFKPVWISSISVFPPPAVRAKLVTTAADPDLFRIRELPNEKEFFRVLDIWRREGKPPYYSGFDGQHMVNVSKVYEVPNYSDDRGARFRPRYIPVRISADGSAVVRTAAASAVTGRLRQEKIITEGNHPGNLVSVRALDFHRRKGQFFIRENKRARFSTKELEFGTRSDKVLNRQLKGYAAKITYIYLENYDPNVENGATEPVLERIGGRTRIR
jgi:hypothetical protein